MLVTAGDESSYNTMTASWGGMGYIWERPSTFIFIRDTRYTYQFLQQHESFTLSFFNENIAMPCVYAVQCQEGIRIR